MFDRYSTETWICSIRGHVIPAAEVAEVGPEHAAIALDVHPRWRISRCLRCDVWVGSPPPADATRRRLPPIEELHLPRRGKALRQAVIVRIISIDKAVHSLLFATIAILGLVLRTRLAGFQSSVRQFLDTLTQAASQTGRAANQSFLAREGTKFLQLKTATLQIVILTAAAYAVVEGVEAVGLWHEKRWAEYLTVVATAGFLPIEIHELEKRVTAFRIGALVVNIAILVYLIYAKRLFGLGRFLGKETEGASSDRPIFSPPF